MNNDFKGYDREKVRNLINKTQANYDQLFKQLTDGVQSNFIASMKYAWICPDAVKFFEGEFTNAMSTLVTDINNTMRSVSEAINSSCETYAAQAGDTWSRVEINVRPFQNYTIRGVIEEYNSTYGQGGSMQTFEDAKSRLNTVKANCKNETSSIANNARESGFIGGDQQTQLINALNTIDQRISDGFADIINKTSTRVSGSIEQFGAIASGTASAYSVK